MHLLSTFSMLAWWEWAAYAFGYSSCIMAGIWLFWMQKKQHARNVLEVSKLGLPSLGVRNIPEVQPQGKRTVWISTAMLMALVTGVSIGYGVRDHQLIENTRMYFGVSVISQQNDHRYMVRIPGFEKEYDWEFCHPVKMPSPLIDIKYEQRFGCKAVNGVGFVSIHEEKNSAKL